MHNPKEGTLDIAANFRVCRLLESDETRRDWSGQCVAAGVGKIKVYDCATGNCDEGRRKDLPTSVQAAVAKFAAAASAF